MNEVVRLSEVADIVINDMEQGTRSFWRENKPPSRLSDPSKCQCGGGCESVLECAFWYWLRKTKLAERGAHRQVQVGRYRVDAMVECDGANVVVELDGKMWHTDKRKDWERDKVLLSTVDAVIHIPYAALTFYPHATFSVLAFWHQRFKLRGKSLTCLSAVEFAAELNQSMGDCLDKQLQREFLEQVELQYEIWHAAETFGWAGSPKAWIHRLEWNTSPITRMVRRKSCHTTEHY